MPSRRLSLIAVSKSDSSRRDCCGKGLRNGSISCETSPKLGRLRSDNAEGRELVVPPYVIPYQFVGDVVFIIDLFHARASSPYDESELES
jgi:plasmid stabilization system protein ParE